MNLHALTGVASFKIQSAIVRYHLALTFQFYIITYKMTVDVLHPYPYGYGFSMESINLIALQTFFYFLIQLLILFLQFLGQFVSKLEIERVYVVDLVLPLFEVNFKQLPQRVFRDIQA